MRYTKTIVCLANSRKESGRCIAGREWFAGRYGPWIRPVSVRDTRELSEEERRYEDGSDPRVLDIVSVEMTDRQEHRYQRENHVIDDGYYWTRQGTVSWGDLEEAVEQVGGPLWRNGESSSHGLNDRVSLLFLGAQRQSLYLVRPHGLTIIVGHETGPQGSRRRVRAEFSLGDDTYRLAVTDPIAERRYLSRFDGTTPVDQALLCVSLGDAYHGYAYKLVASVITP